jgi:transposase-like protein
MPVSDQLIDQLLADNKSLEDLLGEQGILKQLTKKLAERALEAEMEQHLGYAKHDASGKNTGNSRNGKSHKSVRTIHGDIEFKHHVTVMAALNLS